MKIVKVVACAIGFGVLGAGIGLLAWIIGVKMGILSNGFGDFMEFFMSMVVFGILGAALGGYRAYNITRSKDK